MLLEDYALIGDQQAAALVGRNGVDEDREASPELAAG